MESCILIMGTFQKDNLRMEDAKVKADGSNRMAPIMKEISKIMQLMDMENILTSINMFMKDNGKIIYPTAKVRPSIQMEVAITASS